MQFVICVLIEVLCHLAGRACIFRNATALERVIIP